MTLEILIETLDAMDDNPGWLSGDKELIAQLCRCVSEIGHCVSEMQEAEEPDGGSWGEYKKIKERQS